MNLFNPLNAGDALKKIAFIAKNNTLRDWEIGNEALLTEIGDMLSGVAIGRDLCLLGKFGIGIGASLC